MPIVLVTAEGQERSGYVYDDRTGVSYEYPNRYARLVHPGQQFVYHMPRRGYTGSGIVGDIRPSDRPAHWICEVLDYSEFLQDVPLRKPDGLYHEAKPDEGKLDVFWSQGVRPLSSRAFAEISQRALTSKPNHGGGRGYASAEVAAAVEQFAVARTMEWLADNYSGSLLAEMPHSNPGFDIAVGEVADPTLYVEVKGTQTAESSFFLSEGERKFSVAHSERYLLVVISGINLKSGAFHLRYHGGAVAGEAFDLQATQWRGLLK